LSSTEGMPSSIATTNWSRLAVTIKITTL